MTLLQMMGLVEETTELQQGDELPSVAGQAMNKALASLSRPWCCRPELVILAFLEAKKRQGHLLPPA